MYQPEIYCTTMKYTEGESYVGIQASVEIYWVLVAASIICHVNKTMLALLGRMHHVCLSVNDSAPIWWFFDLVTVTTMSGPDDLIKFLPTHSHGIDRSEDPLHWVSLPAGMA